MLLSPARPRFITCGDASDRVSYDQRLNVSHDSDRSSLIELTQSNTPSGDSTNRVIGRRYARRLRSVLLIRHGVLVLLRRGSGSQDRSDAVERVRSLLRDAVLALSKPGVVFDLRVDLLSRLLVPLPPQFPLDRSGAVLPPVRTSYQNSPTPMKEALSTGACRGVLSETGPIPASLSGSVTSVVMLSTR